MEAWFAVWTRSRHEQRVCLELSGKQIETFLPTAARWSVWSDRKKKIDWPLFPGYCFARFRPAAVAAILKCTGVVSVLSAGGQPIPVPDVEIEALRRLTSSGLPYDRAPVFRPGTKVVVVKGPLAGISGRVIRQGPQTYLLMTVELIRGAARVRVASSDVRPVTIASAAERPRQPDVFRHPPS